MTENEAKNVLDNVWDFAILSDDESGDILEKAIDIANKALEEIQQYKAIGTVEEVRMLKDYKELYDVYNLIGTIEEFRNLKYKKNVLPIATIEFSKEDMQKMVDEKVAQIELDIQEIRNKAIDEFAEQIKELFKYESAWYKTMYHQRLVIDIDKIDEVAQHMKAGDNNE